MSFAQKIWSKLSRKDSGLLMNGQQGRGLSQWSWSQAIMAQLGAFMNTRVNYQEEVGDLMLSSLVMSAVNWFATAMPEAPVIVEVPNGNDYERVAGHPLERLWAEPNAYYSGENYAHAIAFSWLVDGNVYFYKVRNYAGEVIETWYIPHFIIEPQYDAYDASTFIQNYLYEVNGRRYNLPVEDVLHIRRGVDPANPRKGIGVVKPLLREVFVDNEASNFSAVTFKNLGLPAFIITPDDATVTLSKDQREDMRKAYEDEFKGDGRGRVLIGSRKVKIDQLTFDPDKLDISQPRRIAEERWASLTGIPAVVLGFGAGLERSTYSNYEHALMQAYKGFLLPTMRQIAPQLTRQLLNEFKDKADARARVRFYTDEMQILQEDRDNRSKRVQGEWQSDLITRNEARVALDREPIAGEDDLFFSPYRAQFKAIAAAPADATSNSASGDSAQKLLSQGQETKSSANDKAEAEAADWWSEFAPDGASELLNAEIAEDEEA